jgi:Kef-type K+ transport system membrane component KefB
MLGIMAVAGVLVDLVGLPDIVGAFLAGLAVNAASDDHPAKGKLEFVGKALFVPIFFVVTGFPVSPVAVGQTIYGNFWLVVAIVAALILGKGVAATIAGRAFGYPRQAKLTMWALTVPQLAATLAATLVGYDTFNAAGLRLLDEKMFNAQIVLVVITSTLGPILTELFAPAMVKQGTRTQPERG